MNSTIRGVLEELSRHTDLIVVSEQRLDESVSAKIDRQSLPDTIHALLRTKSFMLHQQPGTPYSWLWIFSDADRDGQYAWTKQPSPPSGDCDMTDYQLLAASDDHSDRQDAMDVFGEIGGDNSIALLQQGLSDPNDGVRAAAIESLAEIGGVQSIRALSLALNDPVTSLRIAAADALGEIGGPEAVKLLKNALSDENPTVREAAAEWFTELSLAHDWFGLADMSSSIRQMCRHPAG
ncbi:MAG: HEAT repeat domain-containing protein [Woeseia sp.]